MKHPVILDSTHKFTRLLVQDYHVGSKHHGQERVLNDLRQRYWIINARAAVKHAWNDCQLRKNARSTAIQQPVADLPSSRVKPFDRPFSQCGMDYFGPLLVKVGRHREKRYGVLFTCLST